MFLTNSCFYSPLDFSLEHVFIPFDVEYRHSFPFRFAEDMNVMDVPLLPQCIIMFNVPVCQRRITLQKVVITSSPTPLIMSTIDQFRSLLDLPLMIIVANPIIAIRNMKLRIFII